MTAPARLRIAFFTPLPPSKSGIADYSEALLAPLHLLADVTVFTERPQRFDPSTYDAIVYQVGNNLFHDFVYEMALERPGVVVMHEANLHHLIAERTIKRNDWAAYLAEAEFDGGASALEFAQRVKRREVGPDYEGVPMVRRLLSVSRGAIAHSQFVAGRLRAAGFNGPLGVIRHGAWIPEIDRMSSRAKLGLAPGDPLIGIFGFLKPYKRITESLRAFQRLLRVKPEARMILAGEPHPDLPLASMLSAMALEASVRVVGFAAIEDFNGYLAACDIVLNLRYPTVGETSGTLLRSLGLGRAVIVSDIGAFREYPDDICLKVPANVPEEEELLFEYLNLLTSRPDLRAAMGARARGWVAVECPWEKVAGQYEGFLRAVSDNDVIDNNDWQRPAPPPSLPEPVPVAPAAVETWMAERPDERGYFTTHEARLLRTLEITPRGTADQSILEMGAYMQITPALKSELGYGTVRGCYYGPSGRVDTRTVHSASRAGFTCDIDLFDAEKDVFPYSDASFDTVLCGELVEHLPSDPMHMMSEINRILKPGGHVVLTTPNIASLRAIAAILQGYHPGFFPAYLKPESLKEGDARHNREYTPREAHLLLHYAGFDVARLETGPFREEPKPELHWVEHVLRSWDLSTDLRGDGIYVVGRKAAPVRERWPAWLYN